MRSLSPFQKSLIDCVLAEEYEPCYLLDHEIAFLEVLNMIEFLSPPSSSTPVDLMENKENEGYIVRWSSSSDCRLSQPVVRPEFRSPLHQSEIMNIESFSATLPSVLPNCDTLPDEWDLGLHYQQVVVDDLDTRWQQHKSGFTPLSVSGNVGNGGENIMSPKRNVSVKKVGKDVIVPWEFDEGQLRMGIQHGESRRVGDGKFSNR